MTSYTITARNPATESENRIHSDDIAQHYGFRGGLVPGVTVYGYIATGLAEDPDWIARGSAEVRFRKPCYDGETLEIDAESNGTIQVRSRGEVCVTGHASLGQPPADEAAASDAPVSQDAAPSPALRVPASVSSLAAGTPLGWFPLPTEEGALASYLKKISVSDWSHDVIHPGLLLDSANSVLVANVVLPPWIHVESSITHHRAVQVGEPVEVHATVAREWEHKGHRFVDLNVAWRSAGDVAATARHVAIWQLAGTGAP